MRGIEGGRGAAIRKKEKERQGVGEGASGGGCRAEFGSEQREGEREERER